MTPPLVSIGLPVYNGEQFLARAIETLLAQKMGDFELVISDNASTDGTEEVARGFAAVDARIRYSRQERNRGAAWNFTHVLHLADPAASYVKWAAADDEHAPEFLDETLAVLNADPSVVLAHTGSADIDAEGYVVKTWRQQVSRMDSADPAERLRDVLTLRHECFGAFGLIRHDVARATRGLGAYSDSDNVFLLEVALRGRIVHSDAVRFFRRQHPARSTIAFPHARGRAAWFDPDLGDRLSFPTWRIGREFVRAIDDAPLTRAERQRCYRATGVFLHSNWQGLTKNVVRSATEAPVVVGRRMARRVSTVGGPLLSPEVAHTSNPDVDLAPGAPSDPSDPSDLSGADRAANGGGNGDRRPAVRGIDTVDRTPAGGLANVSSQSEPRGLRGAARSNGAGAVAGSAE